MKLDTPIQNAQTSEKKFDMDTNLVSTIGRHKIVAIVIACHS